MAARLLAKSRKVVIINSSFRNLAQSIQASFSSSTKWGRNISTSLDDPTGVEDSSATIWPDPNLGLLAPKDKRLPLPGNIGIGSQLRSPMTTELPIKVSTDDCDVLTRQLDQDRHVTILSQFINSEQYDEDHSELNMAIPTAYDVLECVAQECPQLIRKDFADLFPGVDTMTGPFTVVTLSQKTKQDMTGWSADVELEREELILYFVIAAEEICTSLKELGFWADFIDPSSGRPYLGPYTNATMFETDERYRHFGFRIEDLGCCKVISHRAWGTNVFIGCLFTNAPANSPFITSIIEKHSKKNSGVTNNG